MIKPNPIPIGTLCVITLSARRPDILGLECTVIGHGPFRKHPSSNPRSDHLIHVPHAKGDEGDKFESPWECITPIDPRLEFETEETTVKVTAEDLLRAEEAFQILKEMKA